MDFFPDRSHVWLWSHAYEQYLFAKRDAETIAVCLDRGTTPWAAWAVHRLVHDGTDYVLFHSAATGRYLAHIEDEIYQSRPVQCTYDSPEQNNVLFQAVRAEEGSDDVFISNFTFGDWFHPSDMDTPMRWVVEAIPARLHPPELPPPPEVIPPITLAPTLGKRKRTDVQQPEVGLRRTINYVHADGQGNFNPWQWRFLEEFEGQSVFNLREALANALGEANNALRFTLCVRAGSSGRLTPLVVDLPSNENTMDIVILDTDSPAAQALVYPNIDAP